MRNKWTIPVFMIMATLILAMTSCTQNTTAHKKVADLVLFNGFIYTVSGAPIEDGAIVIHEGKIIALGKSDEILTQWKANAKETRDCGGAFVMPGFIEGHGHFSGMGNNLLQLDLLGTGSWEEIVDSVALRAKKMKPGDWIVGRGWHQEKWKTLVEKNVNGYPYHDQLSKISEDHPVMLFHASGHALLANQSAMNLAGVSRETPDPAGGHIVRDDQGYALGVFEENAMDIIWKAFMEHDALLSPESKRKQWYHAIDVAQQHCLQHGVTSFQDAGSSFEEISRYKAMGENDSLELRLWVMLRHPYAILKDKLNGFPIIRVGHDMFTCRALKSQMDGALGSFGAWLLAPYNDKPGYFGQNTTPVDEIENIAKLAMDHDMQMCVHAIGDRGNREVLNVYEEQFKSHPEKKELRWRIEHAQHLHPEDMPRFKNMGVIASMQGIHCTSDAPFVVKRLGEERARTGAYAWRSLLDLGVIIANGTDVPVERLDPFANLYASVTRTRTDNGQVFFNEQAMTRTEALYSYTLGNAYAAFEEDIKGSLEVGKWADIVVLSENLITCPAENILQTSVLLTILGGEIKYQLSR
jgi:predicted amidohydrolase YtcJ